MARGINKVILVGNLGQDPEVRSMPSGGTVANLRIATSESWKDKQTGEMKEQTEWHTVVLFGRTAEVAQEYLRKGSQVYIEGRLRTRKWQDKTGNDRYTTEVVGNEMQMLGGRGGGGMRETPEPRGDDEFGEERGGFGGGRGGRGGGGGGREPQGGGSAGGAAPAGDFDDDIPF